MKRQEAWKALFWILLQAFNIVRHGGDDAVAPMVWRSKCVQPRMVLVQDLFWGLRLLQPANSGVHV
jgi:hypothetical protein